MQTRENIFAGLKQVGLFPSFVQSQVDGIDLILDEWDTRKLFDLRWLAYILATVYHETAKTMQPIEEYGKGHGHKYGAMVKMSGVAYHTPVQLYYGRGYTQNTWFENYEMLTKDAAEENKGWDFLNHPELLLTPAPAIWATFHCMILGRYTGVGLHKYFNDQTTDWVNARKIINGVDCAEKIGDYAERIHSCLIEPTV